MTDAEKKASANRSDIAVPVATLGVAGIAALLGLPTEAGIVLSSSGVLTALSKALHESEALQKCFSLRGAKRAISTAESLAQRTEIEELEPDPEKFAELLENGLPFIGRATVEEKRRLMEEVLMNGVRSLENEAKRAETVEALKMIEEIPYASVMIFISLLDILKKNEKKALLFGDHWDDLIPRCNLNSVIFESSWAYIFNYNGRSGMSNGKSLFSIRDNSDYQNRNIYSSEGRRMLILSDFGAWLADWITNNPAPRPEAEEASPME
jgi:hypothetical protein